MKLLYCDAAAFDSADSTDLPYATWLYLLHSCVSDVDIFPDFSFWKVAFFFMFGVLQSRDHSFSFSFFHCHCLLYSDSHSSIHVSSTLPSDSKWAEIIAVCKYSDQIPTLYFNPEFLGSIVRAISNSTDEAYVTQVISVLEGIDPNLNAKNTIPHRLSLGVMHVCRSPVELMNTPWLC